MQQQHRLSVHSKWLACLRRSTPFGLRVTDTSRFRVSIFRYRGWTYAHVIGCSAYKHFTKIQNLHHWIDLLKLRIYKFESPQSELRLKRYGRTGCVFTGNTLSQPEDIILKKKHKYVFSWLVLDRSGASCSSSTHGGSSGRPTSPATSGPGEDAGDGGRPRRA